VAAPADSIDLLHHRRFLFFLMVTRREKDVMQIEVAGKQRLTPHCISQIPTLVDAPTPVTQRLPRL